MNKKELLHYVVESLKIKRKIYIDTPFGYYHPESLALNPHDNSYYAKFWPDVQMLAFALENEWPIVISPLDFKTEEKGTTEWGVLTWKNPTNITLDAFGYSEVFQKELSKPNKSQEIRKTLHFQAAMKGSLPPNTNCEVSLLRDALAKLADKIQKNYFTPIDDKERSELLQDIEDIYTSSTLRYGNPLPVSYVTPEPPQS